MEAQEATLKARVSRVDSPTPQYSYDDGWIRRGYPESTALTVVDLADPTYWAPWPWEPTRTRINCSVAVTKAVTGSLRSHLVNRRPPALFRLPEDAASKGAPAQHASVHVTHDPRVTRA